MKVGLIAGGGDLPHHVIEGARAAGHEVHVIALKGSVDVSAFEDAEQYGIAEFGRHTKAFKKQGCTHICFAGNVERPDFKKLKPDWKGLKRLPGAIKAASQGDDGLLTYVVGEFEKAGFKIVSPQDLCAHLLLDEGHLGSVKMSTEHREDVLKACKIASNIGALDIGQGAVVCSGLVLAVEAQEGTDAMLARVSGLPEAIRGTPEERRGVLAKMIKPGQESRVDLPTIGLATIDRAVKAGLAGIVAEAGQAFILDKEAVTAKADAEGLFILGIPAPKS